MFMLCVPLWLVTVRRTVYPVLAVMLFGVNMKLVAFMLNSCTVALVAFPPGGVAAPPAGGTKGDSVGVVATGGAGAVGAVVSFDAGGSGALALGTSAGGKTGGCETLDVAFEAGGMAGGTAGGVTTGGATGGATGCSAGGTGVTIGCAAGALPW